MRMLVLVAALGLGACASQTPGPAQHDYTVLQAHLEGMSVTTAADGTRRFCGSDAALGSHIIAPCMTEAQWRSQQLWIFPAGYIEPPAAQAPSLNVTSGR